MASVLFKFGNQAAFDALASGAGYDSNSLYFIEDTARLYKGSVLMSEQAIFTTTVPQFGSAKENRIYVVTSADGVSLYVKSSTEMVQVGGGTVKAGAITSIEAFNESVITKAAGLVEGVMPDSDTTIPTASAVKGAIEKAAAELSKKIEDLGDPVVNASAARSEDNSGTVITLTRASNTNPISLTVGDLFLTSAEYDSVTHKLKLFVKDVQQPVEVDLGELIPQAVTTADVALKEEIIVTTPVGNFKKGDVINPADVADLQTLLVSMLSQDSNPTVTQPSASVTLNNAGAKEVGTEFTPSYSVTLNPGSYSANKNGAQPTGITATSYAVTDTNGGSASTQTGSFTKFTVTDSTNYSVNATVNYGDGNIPTTYLGKEYAAGQIKAGSKTAKSSSVTPFRNCYWGYKGASNLISPATGITAAQIKALGNKNSSAPSSLRATDMQQIFVAVPSRLGYTSMELKDTGTGLPVTVSGSVTVQVGGLNDYSPIDYTVFYSDNAAAAPGTTTYSITLAK